MTTYKIVNHLSFWDILGQTLLWLILIVITAGLATPFFAYYFVRKIFNSTEIHVIDPGRSG